MMKRNLIARITLFLLLCFVCGFFFSRALFSISIGSLFLFALFVHFKLIETKRINKLENYSIFLSFTLYYSLLVFLSFFTANSDCVIETVYRYSPFFLLSYSFLILSPIVKAKPAIIDITNGTIFFITFCLLLEMAFFQFKNPDESVKMALESKNISNFAGIHHNVIGLLSVAAIICFFQSIRKLRKQQFTYLLLFLVVFLIHYLGLRFAIIAFYIILLYELVTSHISVLKKTFIIISGIIIIFSSFIYIEAFQARVKNTYEDISTILTKKNPNFKSIDQRLIADGMGINILKENWIFGVGRCNIVNAVNDQYQKDSHLLIPENRKFIHNQIICGGASFGFLYILAWFVMHFFFYRKGWLEKSILAELVILGVLHQMVENSLEQQLLLGLFVYIIMFLPLGLSNKSFKV